MDTRKIIGALRKEAFKELERLSNFIGSVGDPEQVGIEELRIRLKPVFERYGVKYAFLFSLRARAGVDRDYDIAVSASLRSALELGGLIVDIAVTLDVTEDLVEVVHLGSAGASILYSVINDGVVIYGNEDEAMNYLWRRYLEFLAINEYVNHPERRIAPNRANTTDRGLNKLMTNQDTKPLDNED
ncbi:hypothetical protein [Vulcanisaeta sp. JCM 16159]|uniref:hypothetical protein n=1 Tax=Vulcanisaeta sp. JCM 16159 TaxID=1295371 RepID=UPI001FB3760F|nr:hypothetical protein [Vulcanisaeta sp. JCM 16159]